jgi:4-hydroxy-tetrahydrodipicolinate synthase
MFQGLNVALVTPFTQDDHLDLPKLRRLVRHHLEQEADGLVLCGTTGESACMTPEERVRVVETAVEEASGRLKIVAGAGARSTRETVNAVRAAHRAGAEGALVVTPFYNRPSQEGLYAHFAAVADASEIPIMLYNVPTRTGVDLKPKIVERLSRIDNLVAVKEARPDLERLTELVDRCGDRLHVLSGHDPNLLPALVVGCHGIVSVTANIAAAEMKRLIDAFQTKDLERARRLHMRLFALHRALAVETNPVPIKCAMNLLGYEVGEVRLPLLPLTPEKTESLREELMHLGFEPVVLPDSVRN